MGTLHPPQRDGVACQSRRSVVDPQRFDCLTRALTTAASRRGALTALAAGLFPALFDAADAEGKRRRRANRKRNKDRDNKRETERHGRNGSPLGIEKKKKKKKKEKSCQPACQGKVCGPDGCNTGDSCGPGCSSSTVCNAQGQCVGCNVPADCAPLSCRTASCTANGTCDYSPNPNANGQACPGQGGPGVCCGGACVECCTNAQCSGAEPFCTGNQCVQCLNPNDCTSTDPCQEATCSTQGQCGTTPKADDSQCPGPGDAVCCGGECVDRDTDERHCGFCGRDCGRRADTCVDGMCTCGNVPECPLDDTCCSGQCHDCGPSGVCCGDGLCHQCCTSDDCESAAPICDNHLCIECRNASDCPDPPPCHSVFCDFFDCVVIPLHDTPCFPGSQDRCCDGVCRPGLDACGNCATSCDNRADSCVSGTCSCGGGPLCPQGSVCQGGACD